MTTTKHTPGPWRWTHGELDTVHGTLYRYSTISADDTEIAEVNKHLPEHHANARLIAAAPELLEAAEWLAECVAESTDDITQAMARTCAAIAKARGE